MNKPTPPAAPDYQALAAQQGQNNIDIAKMQQPNVVGPYGTQTVTYGGTPEKTVDNFDSDAFLKAHPDVQYAISNYGKFNPVTQSMNTVSSAWDYWNKYGQNSGDEFTFKPTATGNIPTITQTLSPEQQKLLDQQNQIKGLLGNLGIQGAESLRGIVGKPLDLSGLPAAPQDSQALRDQAYNAQMSRVNEDYGRQSDDLNSNLVAAGFHPGSKGYDDRQNLLNRGLNDARQQAILNSGNVAQQSYNMDAASRARALSEMLAQRQMPLNEISALMSGSQVSNPFAQAGVGGVNAQGTPIMQGAQLGSSYAGDLYNASAARAGQMNQGLFGLGATGLMASSPYWGSAASGIGSGLSSAGAGLMALL